MQPPIIETCFSDKETGQIYIHNCDCYLLDNERFRDKLHKQLDLFINKVKNGSRTANIEFRAYASHVQLELPF